MFDNPARWVSHGLNMCIRAARGDLVVRVDCHSRYPPDYLSRCVAAAEETGADNVGGVFVPTGRTPTERAVACAMSSPFGGIHWTRHGDDDRVDVDTVPYGAFRPEAFERAGLFDETLVRNQDDEFNLRLRRAGGRIMMDPSIRILYTPRGSCGRSSASTTSTDAGRRRSCASTARPPAPAASFRRLFLCSLLLAVLAPLERLAAILLDRGRGVRARRARSREPSPSAAAARQWRLLPRVIAVFPTFHLAHGAGNARRLGCARSRGAHVATRAPPDRRSRLARANERVNQAMSLLRGTRSAARPPSLA